MFAQLLITVALVVMIAEVLCRFVMARSVTSVLRELFAPLPPKHPETPSARQADALRYALRQRRAALAKARARLESSRRRDELADELAQVETELAEVEAEIAELDRDASADSTNFRGDDGKGVLDAV